MPYPLRVLDPDYPYHAGARGLAAAPPFRNDIDRAVFLELLRDEIDHSGWTCLAYVLMGTHYHAIVRPNSITLSTGFQRLQSRHARYVNRTRDRRGPVWDRRFHSVLIESDEQLLEAARYVALNPTRAGLCERPEDWPWSSYASTIGLAPPDSLVAADQLLQCFGGDSAAGRGAYRAFVEELDPRHRRAALIQARVVAVTSVAPAVVTAT
jgi:putative transposase